jgi:peptidoglycan/LPS O-acetylase OafA/YrhL
VSARGPGRAEGPVAATIALEEASVRESEAGASVSVTGSAILWIVVLVVAALGLAWLVLRLVLRETAKLSARIGPPDRGAPDEAKRD